MPSDAKLVRRLSLTDSILLLAGGIIGSGIFLTAKDVAINTRHPWLFLAVWVVGMGMALLACFAFAELEECSLTPAASTFTCAKPTVTPQDFSMAGCISR